MPAPRLLFAALIFAACAPSGAPLNDAERRAVADEVRAANRALLDALNAHDAAAVLEFYQPGDGFTYVGCTSVITGGEVFAGIVRGYHRAHPDVTYEMGVVALEVLDRDAVVALLQGESDTLKLFTSRVWRRGEEGPWRVAYEHESWPGCSPPALPHPGTAPGDTAIGLAPIPPGG